MSEIKRRVVKASDKEALVEAIQQLMKMDLPPCNDPLLGNLPAVMPDRFHKHKKTQNKEEQPDETQETKK